MITRLAAALSAMLVTGCLNGPLTNVNCEWPGGHAANPLDLSLSGDARHLADDAQTAEDLAIRYADASPSRALHSRDATPYQAVREQCKAALFRIVARQHSVSDDAVAAAVSDRREWLDALVILTFAATFAFVARFVAALMFRGALADSRLLAASLLLVAALAAGGVGVLAGSVWFGLIESIRIGNGHMSYRVERLPTTQHRPVAFAACSVLFATVSLIQHRKVRFDSR